MGVVDMTLRQKDEIVKLFLPDHTLAKDGKVVKAKTCPLCGGSLDTWTPTDTIYVNREPKKVHQICPLERSE